MKRTLLSVLLVGIGALNVYSQVTITSSDTPQAGYSYYENVLNDSTQLQSISAGPAGANQSWDFSSLTNNTKDTMPFLTPANAPYSSDFPSCNAVEVPSGSPYIYYDVTSSAIELLGFASSGAKEVFSAPITYFNLPMNYGDQNTSTSSTTFTYVNTNPNTIATVDSIRVHLTLTISYSIDGWGSVKTSTGTYNALRVFVKNKTVDTTYNHLKSGGWQTSGSVSHSGSAYHAWWASGNQYQVMTINYSDTTTSTINEASWYTGSSASLTSIQQPTTTDAFFSIGPNPSNGILNLNIGKQTGEIQIAVFDVNGTEVKTFSISGSTRIDLSSLDDGLYTMKLATPQNIITRKLVIRK